MWKPNLSRYKSSGGRQSSCVPNCVVCVRMLPLSKIHLYLICFASREVLPYHSLPPTSWSHTTYSSLAWYFFRFLRQGNASNSSILFNSVSLRGCPVIHSEYNLTHRLARFHILLSLSQLMPRVGFGHHRSQLSLFKHGHDSCHSIHQYISALIRNGSRRVSGIDMTSSYKALTP